ncbi:hypothetical protein Droror1_Dr00027182 [Drosera rotundifolia]
MLPGQLTNGATQVNRVFKSPFWWSGFKFITKNTSSGGLGSVLVLSAISHSVSLYTNMNFTGLFDDLVQRHHMLATAVWYFCSHTIFVKQHWYFLHRVLPRLISQRWAMKVSSLPAPQAPTHRSYLFSPCLRE